MLLRNSAFLQDGGEVPLKQAVKHEGEYEMTLGFRVYCKVGQEKNINPKP